MIGEKKTILLIAFKFPPYAGVGSFRWSKITKYLAKMGYKIHVISVDWDNIGVDNLTKDVDHQNIIIHRIPSFYPHNFRYRRYKNNYLGHFLHVSRHGLLKILDIFLYEDEAHFWGKQLIPYCEKLIKKERIKNVISTGAPFMANYWSAKLKVRNPDINLILDFRDPWSKNDNNISKIPFLRRRTTQFEKFAVNNCNVLISVTEKMLKGFMEKVVNNKVQGVVIPNGHDIKIKKMETVKNRDFTFLHAGGLICGRQEPVKSFLRAIDEIKHKIPDLRINFYGKIPNDVEKKYIKLFERGIAKQHNKVHPNEIMQKMLQSFVCLQFNSRYYPMSVSTKIYEYASLKRPTLSINYGGEIDKLMKNYNFGISVNGDNIKKIKEEILKLYEIWKKNPNYQIKPRGIESFHYRNIAKKLQGYLE